MAVDQLRRAGVAIGLGTDVAGGPDLSMWRVMRCAIETRNARAALLANVGPLSARHVFHLATLGGAQALGIPEITGSFAHGKEADILVTDPGAAAPPDVELEAMDADEVLSLCVWRGDDRMTKEVYVRGREVNTHMPAPERNGVGERKTYG
jgi:guanine deaminase